jgi:hypothetical protein
MFAKYYYLILNEKFALIIRNVINIARLLFLNKIFASF